MLQPPSSLLSGPSIAVSLVAAVGNAAPSVAGEPKPLPPRMSLYGGMQSLAGSAGVQPLLPLESAQQVPSGLSRHDQPLGQPASLLHAT
jgi:hypothetical protein